MDHIYAEKHGGATEDSNLALSCPHCNDFKGTDLTSIDPDSGWIVALYHPRQDKWEDHFRLVDGRIEALTARGRVTVRLLQLNLVERVERRRTLQRAGLM
jgi:hypothetical protein